MSTTSTETTPVTDLGAVTAAIHAVIADHERAYNTKDAELLATHYRDRCWAVGVTGQELEGPAQIIETATPCSPTTLADGRARYTPGDVELLLPRRRHLPHVQHRARRRRPAHRPRPGDGRALRVPARAGDDWLVVARQNTLVSA